MSEQRHLNYVFIAIILYPITADHVQDVAPKRRKFLEECQQLMSRDRNFANFRAKLQTTHGACIPFFGL